MLDRLNVMDLGSPRSAILSAVIFNALIIVALIPLALRGVRFRARSAAAVLRRNLLVYGLGGILVPFVGIKLIDVVVSGLGVVVMRRQLVPAVLAFLVLTVLTGFCIRSQSPALHRSPSGIAQTARSSNVAARSSARD